MLTYDGGHLTNEQIKKFEESMTFSDAEGFSKEDTDRIAQHFSHCFECLKKRVEVVVAYLEENLFRRKPGKPVDISPEAIARTIQRAADKSFPPGSELHTRVMEEVEKLRSK